MSEQILSLEAPRECRDAERNVGYSSPGGVDPERCIIIALEPAQSTFLGHFCALMHDDSR